VPRRPGRPPTIPRDTRPLPRIHLARDHPAAEVAARVHAGEWTRIRSGAYVETSTGAYLVDDFPTDAHPTHAHPTGEHPTGEHPTHAHPTGERRTAAHPADARRRLALARLVALREQLAVSYVVSHESAALLWDLPLLTPPGRTHIVQHSKPTGRGASDVVRHVIDVPEDQRAIQRGHSVTTLERTVVDCAMTLGPHGGLVVADAALHAGADRASCRAILAGLAGRHGAPTARTVLDLADDGAESPGETSARFALLRAGLPAPETQIPVATHLGTFWADLGWRDWRLLVEYDGRVKYGAAGMASEAVVREKRRQEAMEEAGWRVVRVVKEDLRQPSGLVHRLARYLPHGTIEGLRPRGALNRSARR
jgi:hypothetical protein